MKQLPVYALGEVMYVVTLRVFIWVYRPKQKFVLIGHVPTPSHEKLMVVANHNSMIDSWLLSAFVYPQRIAWCVKQDIVEEEFYQKLFSDFADTLARFVGTLVSRCVVSIMVKVCVFSLRNCGVVVVDTDNPRNPINRYFLRSVRDKFRITRWFGIFPEGGITKETKRVNLRGVQSVLKTFQPDLLQVTINHQSKTLTFYPVMSAEEALGQMKVIRSRLSENAT